jgi:hypothetical protein
VSDPGGALSAGIIVQDFQIQSTNDKWEATFVARDEGKKAASAAAGAGAIYKKVGGSHWHHHCHFVSVGRRLWARGTLGLWFCGSYTHAASPIRTRQQITMRGFAVYWNTRSVLELGVLPLDQLLKEMGKYEEITATSAAAGGGGKERLTYIVSPVTLEVKLTHHEGNADPATPMYVLCVYNMYGMWDGASHWANAEPLNKKEGDEVVINDRRRITILQPLPTLLLSLPASRFSADVELPLLQMALQTEQYAQAMAVRACLHFQFNQIWNQTRNDDDDDHPPAYDTHPFNQPTIHPKCQTDQGDV